MKKIGVWKKKVKGIWKKMKIKEDDVKKEYWDE